MKKTLNFIQLKIRKYNGEIDFKYDKDFFEVEIIISDNT